MKTKLPFQLNGFLKHDLLLKYSSKNKIVFTPLDKINYHLKQGDNLYKSFVYAYKNVLQAMADYDYEFLEGIMEPNLYKATKNELEDFQSLDYKLEYFEDENYDHDELRVNSQDEFTKLDKFYRPNSPNSLWLRYSENDIALQIVAKGIIGANIVRKENTDPLNFIFGSRKSSLRFYITKQNTFKNLWNKQILVFDVYYLTAKKLLLKDKDGDTVAGPLNNKSLLHHKFRFETYTDEINWTITDIDDYLQGNPYFPGSKIYKS